MPSLLNSIQYDPKIHIKITRNCVQYRPAPSPLAQLHNAFFTFILDTNNPLSAAARKCFSICMSTPNPSDSDIIQALSPPPTLIAIQGAFRTEYALEKQLRGDIVTPDNGQAINLMDCVMLPFTYHQEIIRCQQDGDPEETKRFKMLALTSMVHETAHYLFIKNFGFEPDPVRQSQKPNNGMAWRDDDHGIDLVENTDDVGTQVNNLLFGWTIQSITFADGVSNVVKRDLGNGNNQILKPEHLEQFLGGVKPPIRDISEYSHAPVNSAPEWSEHGEFRIVSHVGANAACIHHGSVTRK